MTGYAAGRLLAAIFTGVLVALPGAAAAFAAGPGEATMTEAADSSAAPAPGSPSALTGPATGLSASAATLTGTVTPGGADTTYLFEYGTGAGYGLASPAQTVAAGTAPTPVSATVASLAPGTLYHYRLVARSGLGEGAGEDRTFRTVDAVLSGRYSVTLTVRRGGGPFGQHPGQTVHRLYRFRARCRHGVCARVLLRRHGAEGTFSSTLRRRSGERYIGIERVRGRCTDGERFRGRDAVSVGPTAVAGSRATEVAGTLTVRLGGCLQATEVADLRGRLLR